MRHEKIIRLFDLMRSGLRNMHLQYEFDPKYSYNIDKLDADTLTERGLQDWHDVVYSELDGIQGTSSGFNIILSDVEPERIGAFSKMLAGRCALEEYERWVNLGYNRTDPNGKPQMELDSLRKINLIAAYENLYNTPHEKRLTGYFPDLGGYYFKLTCKDNSSVDHKISAILQETGIPSIQYHNEPCFLNRLESELYVRRKLVSKELTEGIHILYVTPESVCGPGDLYFAGGIVKSINADNMTCEVDTSPPMTVDVPLRYVLGKYNEEIKEIHFGKQHVEPFYNMNDCVANYLLMEVTRWDANH